MIFPFLVRDGFAALTLSEIGAFFAHVNETVETFGCLEIFQALKVEYLSRLPANLTAVAHWQPFFRQ